MVNIVFLKEDEKFKQLTVSGHANTAEYGKDLVCAAVSAITIGGLNAIAEHFGSPGVSYLANVQEGYVDVVIKDLTVEKIQVILETLLIQLKSIEETYFDYIKVNVIGGASQ